MPRAPPFAHKLQKIVEDIPDLQVRDCMIYCKVCKRPLRSWHKSHCVTHIRSAIHQNNKKLGITRDQCMFDLCVMLCACSLSFNVLDNPHFRNFWKKYLPEIHLPSSTYIRQKYISQVYSRVINNIKLEVKKQYIYVTVDETSDQHLNKIVHVIVRCLGLNSVSPPYLIWSKRLLSTTAKTIVEAVESALKNVGIGNQKVLLLVTDAAAYMKNAGVALKKSFRL